MTEGIKQGTPDFSGPVYNPFKLSPEVRGAKILELAAQSVAVHSITDSNGEDTGVAFLTEEMDRAGGTGFGRYEVIPARSGWSMVTRRSLQEVVETARETVRPEGSDSTKVTVVLRGSHRISSYAWNLIKTLGQPANSGPLTGVEASLPIMQIAEQSNPDLYLNGKERALRAEAHFNQSR